MDLRTKFHEALSDPRMMQTSARNVNWGAPAGSNANASALQKMEQNFLNSSAPSMQHPTPTAASQMPQMQHQMPQQMPQMQQQVPHMQQQVPQQMPQMHQYQNHYPDQFQSQPHQSQPMAAQTQRFQASPPSQQHPNGKADDGGMLGKLASYKIYIFVCLIFVVVGVCAYFGYRWYSKKTPEKKPPTNQWLDRANAPPGARPMPPGARPMPSGPQMPGGVQGVNPFGVPNQPPPQVAQQPGPAAPPRAQPQQQPNITQHGSGSAEDNDPNFTKLSEL